MTPISDDAHREILGHFVTGVVVVTAVDAVGPVGFTCQTFGSLSLDDALVYFAATSESPSWRRIREVAVVGVSILSSDQADLARAFATSGADKFAGVAWRPGPAGSPLLEGAIANLEGTLVEVSHHGDHDMSVVSVDHAETRDGAPVAYFRGGYRVLA